jgi:hypothetical protein
MFKKDSEITQKSVNELSYMNAVLSESMRIFPPTGFGNQGLISSKGGQSVVGCWAPENVRFHHSTTLGHVLTSLPRIRCSIYHYAAYRY